jgi:hypothetical protein
MPSSGGFQNAERRDGAGEQMQSMVIGGNMLITV